MNSLGIWLEGSSDEVPKSEVHINIWHNRNSMPYIEFGIFIFDYSKIDYGKLCISIPYRADKAHFQDMSSNLKNMDLISALFNERLSLSPENGGGKFFKVSLASTNRTKMRVVEINKNSEDVSFEYITDVQGNNYTIYRIQIPEEIVDKIGKDVYLRFRINKIGNTFLKDIATNEMLLDGYEERKSIFEININMIRKLPSEIQDAIHKRMNIKLVNIFLMTDYLTDIIFESKDRKSARVLENHIWDDYIGYKKDDDIQKVVAYQWKKVSDSGAILDFNLFVKMLARDNKKIHWLKVFLFILALGVLGGVFGNLITTKCFNGFSPFKICDFNNKKE
ncbi:MAG TPA: hypothetical protein EYG80_02925 [Flavobacteriaceae bacterium]|nr:hypothetical protein [Flavobacteriaceae bacterium]